MSRPRAFVLAIAFALATGAMGASQSPQFHTGTDTVPIYATVVDRDGRLVLDLTKDDFEVFDNGRRQPIATFATDVQPITVVVMLDRSGSVEEQFSLVSNAAAEFVRHLSDRDRARIGSFSNEIQIHPETFTSDKDVLIDVLKERMQPIGPTPLWTAASSAMTALQGQPGRRVLLIFSDGHDAPLSDQPKVSFAEVRTRAESEEVMVYAIGLVDECGPAQTSQTILNYYDQRSGGQGRGGPGRGGPVGGRIRLPQPPLPLPPTRIPKRTPSMPEPRVSTEGSCKPEGADPSLRTLAAVGGGGFFELKQAADLPVTFARVAQELHNQYLLSFVAPARDGAYHLLDVKVKRSGVTVRARRGYVAPKLKSGKP